MQHKVNVMTSKGSLYLPATMCLRSKGINYAAVEELSHNRIKLRISNHSIPSLEYRKLLFDGKKLCRQHAQFKNKSLVKFMDTMHEGKSWKTESFSIDSGLIVLVPL